jgi:hypothetical protein
MSRLNLLVNPAHAAHASGYSLSNNMAGAWSWPLISISRQGKRRVEFASPLPHADCKHGDTFILTFTRPQISITLCTIQWKHQVHEGTAPHILNHSIRCRCTASCTHTGFSDSCASLWSISEVRYLTRGVLCIWVSVAACLSTHWYLHFNLQLLAVLWIYLNTHFSFKSSKVSNWEQMILSCYLAQCGILLLPERERERERERKRERLVLSIGPTWVSSTWRRRQNPVSETSCFK